jgi:hypothetical protein
LTKDDAYDAMMRALIGREGASAGGRR